MSLTQGPTIQPASGGYGASSQNSGQGAGMGQYTYTLNGAGGGGAGPLSIGAAVPGNVTLAQIAVPRPLGSMIFNEKTSDILLEFHSEEGGKPVTMTFTPEADLTVFEHMRISMLLLMIAHDAIPSRENAMQYVRKYNLERHFTFSA